MSDSHRPALGDLLLKERDHTSPAAEDIAETDAGKSQAFRFPGGLHQHFTDAFGCPHHVRGIDGLVRGDEDKSLDSKLRRDVERILRSAHVIEYGFAGMHLHQGNMLMSRGMKEQLGPEVLEDSSKPMEVAHISNFWFE